MIKLEKGLTNIFGKGVECSVYFEGKEIKGTMYGNDECFDVNNFYQYLLTQDNKLLYCFYNIPDGVELDEINYDYPINIEDATNNIDVLEGYAD